MRILVIKNRALGDVVHVLPALEDAFQMIPDIRFDWVVDPMYMDLPKLHVAVDQVIAGRNKREPKGRTKWDKIKRNFKMIKNVWDAYRIDDFKNEYDYVVDMQGGDKNIPVLAGPLRRYERIGYGDKKRVGYQRKERTGLTAMRAVTFFYDRKIQSNKTIANKPQIEVYRYLMAETLGYQMPKRSSKLSLVYEITKNPLKEITDKPVVIFFQATSGCSGSFDVYKAPSVLFWRDMVKKAVADGYHVGISALGEKETERANQIAEADPENTTVLADLPLKTWFTIINQSIGAIGGDTGLTHLNSAFSKPTLGLYIITPPTFATLTGIGITSDSMVSQDFYSSLEEKKVEANENSEPEDPRPCNDRLDRDEAWSRFKTLIERNQP